MANQNKKLVKTDPSELLRNMVRDSIKEVMNDMFGLSNDKDTDTTEEKGRGAATAADASFAAGQAGANDNTSILNTLLKQMSNNQGNIQNNDNDEMQKMKEAMNVMNQKLEESQNINRLLLGALGNTGAGAPNHEPDLDEAFAHAFGPQEEK